MCNLMLDEPRAVAVVTITPDFLRAGRAVFTVANATGEHYTYRVRATEETDDHPQRWFAELLAGPDNTSDYVYLGMYLPDSGEVRLTRASRHSDDSRPVRVLRWAIQRVHDNRPLPAGYSIRHEGRCGRCSRTLTDPHSLDTGLGPECRKYLGMGS